MAIPFCRVRVRQEVPGRTWPAPEQESAVRARALRRVVQLRAALCKAGRVGRSARQATPVVVWVARALVVRALAVRALAARAEVVPAEVAAPA